MSEESDVYVSLRISYFHVRTTKSNRANYSLRIGWIIGATEILTGKMSTTNYREIMLLSVDLCVSKANGRLIYGICGCC